MVFEGGDASDFGKGCGLGVEEQGVNFFQTTVPQSGCLALRVEAKALP